MGYHTRQSILLIRCRIGGMDFSVPWGCRGGSCCCLRLKGRLLLAMPAVKRYDVTKKQEWSGLILKSARVLSMNGCSVTFSGGDRKVAQLVIIFIDLGGHQIQINAINRDRLLDAQAHPEQYPNLMLRVWGWSGYFNELNIELQNHVSRRMEFSL